MVSALMPSCAAVGVLQPIPCHAAGGQHTYALQQLQRQCTAAEALAL